ncbi:MAG: GNAT family N-acetyltransferase [Methylotenera sp.]|uniref:GNAT family N-acetyltransferase n=1 Tax=Methylotenera sp. TaxID=2051956 RepID=UPI00271E0941|nr:GNAT family N-acetyltransferase [Methylotenera sp.]MDO9150600.1 GNAT family N-acetyltransferase [Methylotenera sp.]
MPVTANARKGLTLQDSFNIQFNIQKVTWQTHAQQLMTVREAVFIAEQNVPLALEWDGLDETAQHLLALSATGEAIGCARLLGDGSVGRMAVMQPWRGLGVGTALLKSAIAYYQQLGIRVITLSAQVHAIAFYERFGFKVCSEAYVDAGILHRDMQRIDA